MPGQTCALLSEHHFGDLEFFEDVLAASEGQPALVGAGRELRTVDLHALRNTFGTHLSRNGVAPCRPIRR